MSTATEEKSDEAEEIKAEAVPKDTAAELERVKQLIGANMGIDMRSPGQVKQAEEDAAKAQAELEEEQAEEAKRAEEEALAAGVEEDVTAVRSQTKARGGSLSR